MLFFRNMNEAPVRKNRILVVDDEPEIVDLLKSFLSGKGYEVNGALNAEEAFGILDKKNTDLILLDIKMPGIQGTEVAKIAKEKYPFIKIIMVTGYADQAEDLLKNNILSGLFIKPIQLQQLYKKILETLNSQDLAKAILWVKMMTLLAVKDILTQNYKNN